jgi:hypothetical protein
MADRYVLLSLSTVRAAWSGRVGGWATTGAIPVEFVRCLSLAEVRSRIEGGRPFSALLLDGTLPSVDRDVLAAARDAGIAAVVVDGPGGRDWREVGADHVLSPDFTRDDLLDALGQHARLIGDAVLPEPTGPGTTVARPGQGLVVAVTGPGGVGTSSAAIALAEGLAGSATTPDVLLADLCRVADQAMLHDSRTVVPSIQEVVEAHRSAQPRVWDIRAQTFRIEERGYHLLLGLRRPRQWLTLRPRALDATLASLQSAFDLVVCDIESDFEGEEDTGSVDIEERHMMARLAVREAAAVVVVGRADMKGLHGLIRVVLDLHGLGVEVSRILPALAFAPRSPRERGDLTAALASLLAAALGKVAEGVASPVFLPVRRVDKALRDGIPMPRPLPRLLAGGVATIINRELADRSDTGGSTRDAAPVPQRVVPGSLSATIDRDAP